MSTSTNANDVIEQGIRRFRAQGCSWHTAGERAAESAIKHIGLDPASADAFALRSAFQATARGMARAERGL